jgi:hypothetical protein
MERIFARRNIFAAAAVQREFELLKKTPGQQKVELKYELPW